MTAPILAVHGVGNYRVGSAHERAAALSAAYSAALGRPVAAFYYAHLLREGGRQGSGEQLTPAERALLESWAAALGVPEQVAMGHAAMPVRLLADWIARTIGRTNDEAVARRVARFLIRFVRDAAAYLDDPERRKTVRKRLADEIIRARPRVVIAHSLGSVVAYEALNRVPANLATVLITVGSPLAMPGAIFDRLEPGPQPDARNGRAARPTSVAHWFNLADPGDIVAVPRPLHRRFTGLLPADDRTVSISTIGVHGFADYLASALLRHVLTTR